jgi:hypothetical protein
LNRWQVFPGEDNKSLVNKVLNFAIHSYLEKEYFVILATPLSSFTIFISYLIYNDQKGLDRPPNQKKGPFLSIDFHFVVIVIELIVVGVIGTEFSPVELCLVSLLAILSTVSIPEATFPKIT